MLMRVLKRLAAGDRYSNKLMAKELGIDEGMVEQMLIQLAQMKYIEKEDMTSCSGVCNCGNGSKKASCCSSKTDIIMWRITSKGKEAALRVAH
ncbi:FeoC-like transcriptional regulator [Clostridium estertheticum]|uniref:FeoC-like transcriptional regulator n=1 Tax=Clostridium estertheticum TaxID=238834 RepID=UPI001C0A97BA|nr:FeoC-like transcriptional regulator [Clostridium estertheticum]MBU3073707.1 transcriptional regulator [Clostridium estertheticum]MBU3163800.1 transcriptional regulator [Clostridium estertheticum]